MPASQSPADLIAQFDAVIRRDPGGRGLIAAEPRLGPLGSGHLAGAASELAQNARMVALVTGFFIPKGDPPAAETDGPPGSVLLAWALDSLGIKTLIVTDERCREAVSAAVKAGGLDPGCVRAAPREGATGPWRDAFFKEMRLSGLSHLIAIERVGPSHTADSLAAQSRTGPVPAEEFAMRVPVESRDVCHNMRGESIDAWSGNLHRLFDDLPRAIPGARTIGVGDGGNEIGMGAVPWECLASRLPGEHAGRLPCRIACDWNIIAGTSNWGAAALGAALLLLRGRASVLVDWTADREQALIEAMVTFGPAVDGVTRRREPTVDGLPFLTYIQPWEGIRRLLGLP